PLRQRSGFQPNSLEAIGVVPQHLQESFRLTGHLTSCTILPASSTMQTLVSLTDTSSPAKWAMLRFSFRCLRPHMRTSFHHQPEAQHPISSAIHKLIGRLPHLVDNAAGGNEDN